MYRSILAAFAIIFSVTAHAGTFLFLGGSNTRGYGNLDDQSGVYENISDIYVWQADDSGWIQAPSEPIYDPTIESYDAFYNGDPSDQGHSYQLAFCNELLNLRPGMDECRIVIAARHGTRVKDWKQKYRVGPYSGNLYGAALDRVSELRKQGVTFDGVFIWQGGRDADGQDGNAGYWAGHFEWVLHHLRFDMGDPNIPMAFMQLGENYDNRPYWNDIKERQADMHAGYRIGMVPTQGYEKFQQDPNQGHYSAEGYRGIGEKAAEVMNGLLP